MPAFELKFNTVRSSMSDAWKTWSVNEKHALLSDVAKSIKGWVRDLDHLSYFDESNVPSIAKAKQYLQRAWENRDNKSKCIQLTGMALQSLKNYEKEAETTEYKTYTERKTAKAVWGEQGYRMQSSPQSLQQLHDALITLESFTIKDSNYISKHSIKSISDNMSDISLQYGQDMEVRNYANSAIKALKMAEDYRHNDVMFRRYITRAMKAADSMGVAIERNDRPDGFKYDLDERTSGGIERAIKSMEDVINGYKFSDPTSVSRQFASHARNMAKQLNRYNDPTADRYAQNLLDSVGEFVKISRHATAKSDNMMAWHDEDVLHSMDGVLNDFYKLRNHIEFI